MLETGPFTADELEAFEKIERAIAAGGGSALDKFKAHLPRYNQWKRENSVQQVASDGPIPLSPLWDFAKDRPATTPLASSESLKASPPRSSALPPKKENETETEKNKGCCRVM